MKPDKQRGFVALGLTVICWVGSSELMQWMEEGDGYDRPVAITMSCALSFLLYGAPTLLTGAGGGGTDNDGGVDVMVRLFRRLGLVAGTFALLWISANLAFTASLERTSSASAVTIASTSAAFALACSVAVGVEVFSVRKCVAVVLTCIGTGLTCLADADDDGHSEQLLGDGLALASAAMYALYLVLYQKDVGNKASTEDFLFLVGVWSAALVPLAFLFEPAVIPSATQTMALVVNAVIGTAVSERAWLYGATQCGPTTATMALALTIPLTAAVDFARGRLDGLHGGAVVVWLGGLVLICLGFVIASTDDTPAPAPSTASGVWPSNRETSVPLLDEMDE
eukprot:m.13495 g.13495  ORF g.13495 m.13495 type:complete len:339 (+) comp3050_c0_seq1:288-1304(+)